VQIRDHKGYIASAAGNIELLRSHIVKENAVLFPIADKMIPIEKQKGMLVGFEDYEEKVMGKGTHENFMRPSIDLRRNIYKIDLASTSQSKTWFMDEEWIITRKP